MLGLAFESCCAKPDMDGQAGAVAMHYEDVAAEEFCVQSARHLQLRTLAVQPWYVTRAESVLGVCYRDEQQRTL